MGAKRKIFSPPRKCVFCNPPPEKGNPLRPVVVAGKNGPLLRCCGFGHLGPQGHGLNRMALREIFEA